MRILIADDSALVRQGILALLCAENDFEVCGEVANGTEAIEQCHDLNPDIVLLDISMPGMGGLDVARLLKDKMPSIKILLMSQHDPFTLATAVQDARADGCVDKTQLGTALVPEIRRVYALHPGN